MRIDERAIRTQFLALVLGLLVLVLAAYCRSLGLMLLSGFVNGLIIGYITAEVSVLKYGLTIHKIKFFVPRKQEVKK